LEGIYPYLNNSQFKGRSQEKYCTPKSLPFPMRVWNSRIVKLKRQEEIEMFFRAMIALLIVAPLALIFSLFY